MTDCILKSRYGEHENVSFSHAVLTTLARHRDVHMSRDTWAPRVILSDLHFRNTDTSTVHGVDQRDADALTHSGFGKFYLYVIKEETFIITLSLFVVKFILFYLFIHTNKLTLSIEGSKKQNKFVNG